MGTHLFVRWHEACNIGWESEWCCWAGRDCFTAWCCWRGDDGTRHSGIACLDGKICNANKAGLDAVCGEGQPRSAAADSTQPRRIICEIRVELKLPAFRSARSVWMIYKDAVRTAQ